MIRIISDVHGDHKAYLRAIEGAEYSIQLGDFWISPDKLNINFHNHKFIFGNHEDLSGGPNDCRNHPMCLGNFGEFELGGLTGFFMSGAWSIDWRQRTPGLDWFADEELSYGELANAIDFYEEIKPDIVLTHEAPLSIVENFANPKFPTYFGYKYAEIIKTRTGQALQEMFEIHQPKIWRFGHWHCSWRGTINGTDFRCLNIGEVENL